MVPKQIQLPQARPDSRFDIYVVKVGKKEYVVGMQSEQAITVLGEVKRSGPGSEIAARGEVAATIGSELYIYKQVSKQDQAMVMSHINGKSEFDRYKDA